MILSKSLPISVAAFCLLWTPCVHAGQPVPPHAWLTPEEGAQESLPRSSDVAWWDSFADDALDALERKALSQNHDLGAALALARTTRANARISASALLPAASAEMAYGRGTGDGSKNRGIELVADFAPDIFGGKRASARAAGREADAAEADARMAALNLSLVVAQAYFERVMLYERIALAEKIAADAERLLHLIEMQNSLGAVSQLEVEQQRNAAATFAAAVPELQRLAEVDEHILSTLTGDPPSGLQPVTVKLASLPLPRERPPSPIELIAQRPDVAAAELRLEAARFDVKAARAALLPHLSLAVDGGVGADSATPVSMIGGLVAGLVQPVFQGGALRGRVHASRAHLEQTVEQYWQTLIDALRTVEDGLTDQRRLTEYETRIVQAVQSADKAQRLAEARVTLGAADYTTLLLTQRALYQAEDSQLQIRQQRLVALARLRAASSSGAGLVTSRAGADGPASSN